MGESGDRDLTLLERRLLEFERRWWQSQRLKEQAIRGEFDMSAAGYFQMLNCLIDDPRALRADPALVNRLSRLRRTRRARRFHSLARGRAPSGD